MNRYLLRSRYLLLVSLPTSVPSSRVILPHPLHRLGVSEGDLGEFEPVIVARGFDPEGAVAVWRAGRADHN